MAITQSGTSITFNDATTQTTAYTGAVTSVATSGGVTGGTITTTGTLSLDTNNVNGVGSIGVFWLTNSSTGVATGGTYSGSYLFYVSSLGTGVTGGASGTNPFATNGNLPGNRTTAITIYSGVNLVTLSPVGGTWRALGAVPKNYVGPCCAYNASPGLFIRTA